MPVNVQNLRIHLVFNATATGFLAGIALLVNDAQGVLGALFFELVAHCFPGDFLVLAEEPFQPVLLPDVHPGVQPDCRNLRIVCLLGDGTNGLWVRHGDRDPIHLGVDRVLDQVRLVRRLGIGGIPEINVVFFRGVLGTFAHEVPESIPGRTVGDHRHRHTGSIDGSSPAGASGTPGRSAGG